MMDLFIQPRKRHFCMVKDHFTYVKRE